MVDSCSGYGLSLCGYEGLEILFFTTLTKRGSGVVTSYGYGNSCFRWYDGMMDGCRLLFH